MDSNCEICGEPIPPGEFMFKFHGYSGPCPKPPIENRTDLNDLSIQAATHIHNTQPDYEGYPPDTKEMSKIIDVYVKKAVQAETKRCADIVNDEIKSIDPENIAVCAFGCPLLCKIYNKIMERLDS